MSDTLENLMRSLAKSGRLNHLSVGYDIQTGGWFASYRGVLDADKRLVTHADPADALMAALSGKKPPPPPPPPKKTRARPAPPPVAAPVDDDEDLL